MFTITQKRIVGTQSYFAVVRLVVQDTEVGGTIMEAQYSCPVVYAFGVLAVFMEIMALRYNQYLPAVLVPIFWCIFHAFSCFSYQTEKEKMDAKIREVLMNWKIQSSPLPRADSSTASNFPNPIGCCECIAVAAGPIA